MQPIKHTTTINRTKNWRDVAGYEGLYKVSYDGEVSTTRRPRVSHGAWMHTR